MTATLTHTPSPVVIYGHPDEDPNRLTQVARLAIHEQFAPLVIHPQFHPWLLKRDGGIGAFASPCSRSLVGMVARHSGGRLWIVLQDGDEWPHTTPKWVKGVMRLWTGTNGGGPTRRRMGTWNQWENAIRVMGVGHGDV